MQGLLIQLQRSEMGRRLQAGVSSPVFCGPAIIAPPLFTEWPLNIYLIVSFVGLKLEVGLPRQARLLISRSW